MSFAYLVYSSSWIKYHYPAEFAAALLNAQPMGFYSPHTIVRDARRHGVQVLGPDLNASRRDATLEPRPLDVEPVGRPLRGFHAEPSHLAIRLGLRSVRGLHDALLDRIDDERADAAVHRPRGLRAPHRRDGRPGRGARDRGRVRAAASASRAAPRCGPRARSAPPGPTCAATGTVVETLPGVVTGIDAPSLPGMTEMETVAPTCGRWVSPSASIPTEFVRDELTRQGRGDRAPSCASSPDRTVVEVAGVVTHRQQPATAKGTVFLNLEDETGLVNVICAKGVWKRFRMVARGAPALRVRGVLEKHQGVTNLVAGPHHPPADQPGRACAPATSIEMNQWAATDRKRETPGHDCHARAPASPPTRTSPSRRAPTSTASIPRIRDRAPRMHHHDTLGDVMLIDNGKSLVPFWLVAAAGRPTEEVRLDSGKRFEELWRGGWDPVARLADQDTDGVSPRSSTRRSAWCSATIPTSTTSTRASTRTTCGSPSSARRRRTGLIGIGQTALRTPEEGIRDLEAIKALGLRGVMLPGIPPAEDYDDPMYDEFWDAVVDLGLPPSFHILTSRSDTPGRRPRARAEAQQLHDDPARQPGHHRHADLRRGVRAPSRPASRVRRGRRGLGAALDVPRRSRATTAIATG